jgi:hypothetical protein
MPFRRLHYVLGDRKGTPEVHGKMDLSKHMLFQSVRLVGAVGIEFAELNSKPHTVAALPRPTIKNWCQLVPSQQRVAEWLKAAVLKGKIAVLLSDTKPNEIFATWNPGQLYT